MGNYAEGFNGDKYPPLLVILSKNIYISLKFPILALHFHHEGTRYQVADKCPVEDCI